MRTPVYELDTISRTLRRQTDAINCVRAVEIPRTTIWMRTSSLRRSTLGALALVFLGACDPGFTVQGDVVDGSGHAVAGAQIAFTCGGDDEDRAETGSDGRFRMGRIGIFDDACAVEIRPADRPAVSFAVMANCTKIYKRWVHHDMCSEVTVHAKLP